MSQRESVIRHSSTALNAAMVNGDGASQRIALIGNRAYLSLVEVGCHDMSAMVRPGATARPLMLAGLLGGLLVAATAGLWIYYGTAVFFELIRAGWMACF